jgi:hypothetical protein
MTKPSGVAFAVMTAMLAVVGCHDSGPETFPVRGVVRYTDGKVLRGGSIEFELTGREQPVLARGAIGPDGSFVLGTNGLDDGAMQGTHRVAVISDYEIGNGAERPGLIPDVELHPKYRNFRTSGLVQEVVAGDNTLIIEVEYAPRDSEED